MTEFRHKVGDGLYDLFIYEAADAPGGGSEETVMHTIIRRTARHVYVHPGCDRPGRFPQDRLVRFSVADLERDGMDWNAANRMLLYVRPLPHWPLMPAQVRKPEPLALTGGQS